MEWRIFQHNARKLLRTSAMAWAASSFLINVGIWNLWIEVPKIVQDKEGLMVSALDIKRDEKKGKIWSYVRSKWLVETPEERVRQEYLLILVNEYGFSIDQIAEERDLTGRGSAGARADFVIWRTELDKANDNPPFIIVECKSDNVTIKPQDYTQGENYARICGAPFFVTHNSRETKYWRVKKDKVPGYVEEIENIPHGDASDSDIKELLSKLRAFKEKEFADLLHQCHNVIRNREKKDPAAAFDEIAKVLFIKVYVERQLLTRRNKENLFTVDVLNRQIAENPLDNLFQETKRAYTKDKIFDDDERINLKPATGEEIVRRLQQYNLSDTSEDVKGVAFERFLGRTFRGEIGQFFTPRTIVEFMVHMVNPNEGDVVCDPASGSGGFLIRVFEIVREKILADADREYNEFKIEVEADKSLSDEKRAKKLQDKYTEIQESINQRREGSRLWKLANHCIFGTDANDRMARTSKMNMIMHGDGHGGVHHHDGFLNVNGIFEGRFDIILTNPPFGSNVEPSDKVLEADITVNPAAEEVYIKEYGDRYREACARVKAALNQPIAQLFELPPRKRKKSETVYGIIKTELLFIERCLDLLAPGGQLGIVLPEGVFNNQSVANVREFTENRAFIRAVVSLPPETFLSSGASVKCSLLFLQKFREDDKQRFDDTYAEARLEIESKYAGEIVAETKRLETAIQQAKSEKDTVKCNALQKELKKYLKEVEARQIVGARKLLKERFNYQIFMYEAEKVGISATGEEDKNELYPNPNQPQNIEKTCIEWYREFLADPIAFTAAGGAE
jgi:type I restriction enzyme M protein